MCIMHDYESQTNTYFGGGRVHFYCAGQLIDVQGSSIRPKQVGFGFSYVFLLGGLAHKGTGRRPVPLRGSNCSTIYTQILTLSRSKSSQTHVVVYYDVHT